MEVINLSFRMLIYFLAILVLSLAITLWSMRGFHKKPVQKPAREVKRGSIIMLDDKVQHYQ